VGNTNKDTKIKEETDPTNDGKNMHEILEIDGVSISSSEKQRYKVELATRKITLCRCTAIWLEYRLVLNW
jgi:hypothetical protein